MDHEYDQPAIRLRSLVIVGLVVLLGLAAFLVTGWLLPEPGEGPGPTALDDSSDRETATPLAFPVTETPQQTATSDSPTSSPSPTATPTVPPTATPPPPTATPPPPTNTPASPPAAEPEGQAIEAQLDAQAGVARVVGWYNLVVAGRFDEAYALWSDRMKANFPRQGNLDQRWARTVEVAVQSVQVVSASGDRMTVAIDFVERLEDGTTRRFIGSWYLVASANGWLLDSPSF